MNVHASQSKKRTSMPSEQQRDLLNVANACSHLSVTACIFVSLGSCVPSLLLKCSEGWYYRLSDRGILANFSFTFLKMSTSPSNLLERQQLTYLCLCLLD